MSRCSNSRITSERLITLNSLAPTLLVPFLMTRLVADSMISASTRMSSAQTSSATLVELPTISSTLELLRAISEQAATPTTSDSLSNRSQRTNLLVGTSLEVEWNNSSRTNSRPNCRRSHLRVKKICLMCSVCEQLLLI